MMATKHVLCVGSANIDHVLEVDELPRGEGKQVARMSRWGGGGVAATAAVAVARLGGRATWCGAIGDDSPGRDLVAMFGDAGVAVAEKSVVPGARTAVAAVVVNARGERWLGWYGGDTIPVPGAGGELSSSRIIAAQLPEMATVDAVVADQMSVDLTCTAFRAAREGGKPRVLDFEEGLWARSADLPVLADNVIFSDTGLSSYTSIQDVDSALAEAGRRLPHATVAVTLGPAGSAWLTAEGVVRVPAYPVAAKDTTGCGDVFHGAYALAVAEGRPVAQAAGFATAAAALKAERGSAWLGMPDRADTEALIRKGRL